MNLTDEQKRKLKEAMELLHSGYNPGATRDIAEVLREANENCCGCGWVEEAAEILE